MSSSLRLIFIAVYDDVLDCQGYLTGLTLSGTKRAPVLGEFEGKLQLERNISVA